MKQATLALLTAALTGCNAAVSVQQIVDSTVVGSPTSSAGVIAGTPAGQAGAQALPGGGGTSVSISAAPLPLELAGVAFYFSGDKDLLARLGVDDDKPQPGEPGVLVPQFRSTDGQFYGPLRATFTVDDPSVGPMAGLVGKAAEDTWETSNWSIRASFLIFGPARDLGVGATGSTWCTDKSVPVSGPTPEYLPTPGYRCTSPKDLRCYVKPTCPVGTRIPLLFKVDDMKGRKAELRWSLEVVSP